MIVGVPEKDMSTASCLVQSSWRHSSLSEGRRISMQGADALKETNNGDEIARRNQRSGRRWHCGSEKPPEVP
jgi:hypothetical protein